MNLENYTEEMALAFCEAYIKVRLHRVLVTTPITVDEVGRERLTGLVEEYLKEVDVLFNMPVTDNTVVTASIKTL